MARPPPARTCAHVHTPQCHHPGIIDVYAFYRDSKYMYLVTELVGGGELLAAMADEETEDFSEEAVRLIMIQVCEALEYLHARNIAHRDLKVGLVAAALACALDRMLWRAGAAL